MKKCLLMLILIVTLCGCVKKKNTECILNNEENDTVKSYIRVSLESDNDVVKTEELYAVYKFKDEKLATEGYKSIEKTFEEDDTLKLVQNKENITVKGKKDVSDMKYDRKSKISYYEQLGYTCK